MLTIISKENVIKSENFVKSKEQKLKVIMKCDIVSYGELKNFKADVIKGQLDIMTVVIIPEKSEMAVVLLAYGKRNNTINKESYFDIDETLLRCVQDISTKIVRTLYNPDIDCNKDRINKVIKFIKDKENNILEVRGLYYPMNSYCELDEFCNHYFEINVLNKLFELE